MVIVAVTASYFFRRKLYNTFFALHVLFAAVIIVSSESAVGNGFLSY